ncbi:hypothetical protein C6500_13995 [Candidatus Poribacteria bacterium]|nr:MAG: hypothetical protein C6500_13995 [Candidatus Poribacteria bacterium]
MIHRHILTSLFLITFIPLIATALPPRSPAGGGMLRLDETHDFVATVEAWFPNRQFKGLTAEAWVYFEELPVHGTFWSIIGQQGRFNLVIHGNIGSLGAWGYAEGRARALTIGVFPLPEKEWIHVTAIYNAGARTGFNGKGREWCSSGGRLIKSNKPLRIGGIIPQDKNRSHFIGDNVKFQGYIDEVRISKVVRYVGPEWDVPNGKFQVDRHTISLWHFDEAPGANLFKDATLYGYDLWRSGVLAVEAQGKLTTTWGKLKQ